MARSGDTRPDPFASPGPPLTQPAATATLRFEVLGHLRARRSRAHDGAEAEPALGGPKQRLVLALLLARPNQVVSTDRLIDEVWGEDAPDTARHTLQSYLSELRKVIGPALERAGAGYSLRVDTNALDALEFESLVSEGNAQTATDPARAIDQLRQGLALWHGQPFYGFADHDALRPEVTRLEELRLGALETLVRAELDRGRHHAVISDLDRLTVDHPYREELRALQMLALYRSGRQAEALRAFQRTARTLSDELGIDPSPSLARLEQQILVQDPALDLPVGPGPSELAAATAPIENPYKGLQPFRESDHDAFHGRSALTDQIVRAVTTARMVAVVGPSGSGKSSVIHAGVIPAMRHRGGFVIATMQPGARPFLDLEMALIRNADASQRPLQLAAGDDAILRAALRILPDESSRLLLVIDQFEELFTLVSDTERSRFLRAVATAAEDPRGRVRVLLALRADFYDRPMRHREFARVFTEHVVHVLPLSDDELEEAATAPARQFGLTIEPRLLAALINDVQGQPNSLPLFQYALTELYDRRDGATLTYDSYRAFGALRRVVANRADELYATLEPDQQAAARQLFLRLVAVAGDVEGRRRILASELTDLEVDTVALQAAIEAFIRHRLITLDRDPATGAPTVEVAHEALLHEWRLLRDWLDAARADLRVHRGFAIAVDEWIDAGRDDEYLLSGGRLVEYERWAGSTSLRLTTTEREFLDAAVASRESADAAERERRAAETKLRRGARRRTWALVVALAGLVAVLVAIPLAPGESAQPKLGLFGFFPGRTIDDLAIAGFERAARDHEFEPVVVGATLSDPAGSLEDLADDSELVLVGLNSDELLTPAIIEAHPDTTFVVIDIAPPPGSFGFSFAVHEGSFLVGAAAALESRTGVVGFVGGQQLPRIEEFRAGFEAGAHAVDPEVDVLAAYVSAGSENGFISPVRAREVATDLYARGADVVFHAAGESGYGVFEAADAQSDVEGRHLWAIGVDSDEYLTLPARLADHVLTSMLKRFDLGVYKIVEAYLAGELEATSTVFTLADGGVGYSTSGNHLAATAIARVDALSAEIASGRRIVPHVPTGPVDPPLGAATPTPVHVLWDGRACGYDGPSSWRVGDLVRFDIDNTTGAAVQVAAKWPTFPPWLAGVEVPARSSGTVTLELGDDQPFQVLCQPVDGATGGASRPVEVLGRTPGEYTTGTLGLTTEYLLPEGWDIDERPGGLFFGPPGWTERFAPLVVFSDVRAADQTCQERTDPSVGVTAAALANWLAAHRDLDATPPRPVELARLQGFTLDHRLAAGRIAPCEVAPEVSIVPTVFRPHNDSAEMLWWGQSEGWIARYYLLDVPDGGVILVAIEVEGDQAAFDALVAVVQPVLDSFVFTA